MTRDFYTSVQWEARFNWFEACHRDLYGNEFNFLIEAQSEVDSSALQKAREAFLIFGKNIDANVDFVFTTLVDRIRSDWDVFLSEEEFVDLLTMDVFKFKLDGRTEVMFNVGDVFGGHRINLVLDSGQNPIVAKLDY